MKYLDLVAHNLLDSKDSIKLRSVKTMVAAWCTTSIVMIFYVAFSYWVFQTPYVAVGGAIFTLLHLLAPIVFRVSQSLTLAGLTISFTGLAFQVLFSAYNGGVHSPCLVWLTVHPVILSFFGGRRLVMFSISLNLITLATMFYLSKINFFPADQLGDDFSTTMFITSLVLLDIIVACYTIIFIGQTRKNENDLMSYNQFKDSLIRIISHDVKNALAISNSRINLMNKKIAKSDVSKEELSDFFRKMGDSNELINSICKPKLTVEWVLSENKEMKFNMELYEISKLANYIREYFSISLNEKNITLEFENVLENSCIYVDVDVFKTQVINNLISNAIKFSNPGSKIVVRLENDENVCRLNIIDHGIGISRIDLNKIINGQLNHSKRGTAGERGTGLGLSIVKTVLNQMNSDMQITANSIEENPNNHGTTVSLEIPNRNVA